MQNSQTLFLIPEIGGFPGPEWLLSALLFVTFILHLLLVNSLIGVAAITLCRKIKSLLSTLRAGPVFGPEDDQTLELDIESAYQTSRFARTRAGKDSPEYVQDTLLPKGVAFAVNLGIPPFLFLQCVFAQFIYVSSVLMAQWWLSVMFVVMLAYYGMYLNMMRHRLSERARTLALGLSLLLLLFNAYLFVNNITLLQAPEHWSVYAERAEGSFLNFADPQVLPRYLHIMLASLAVGGLCLALPEEYALRKARRTQAQADSEPLTESAHNPAKARKKALAWFIYPTLLQIPVGLWFFLSLAPSAQSIFYGGDFLATVLSATAICLLIASLLLAVRQKAFGAALCALFLIICMAGMRSLLRKSVLTPVYAPEILPFSLAPFSLFLISLGFSAVILFYLGKVYLRNIKADRAPLADFPAAQEPAGSRTALDLTRRGRERREMLLVLELPTKDKDEVEEPESNDPAGPDKGIQR